MPRFGFTRRLASFWTASLVAMLITLFPLTVVRAQDVVLCAASASALTGSFVTVNADQPQANVRSGPNSFQYGKVGLLYSGESAPALGRSVGGDWIKISCPGAPFDSGWIYATNVTVTSSTELPIIEIPATPTPVFTATVNATLAAAYPPTEPIATRMPTFTPAPPVTIPTFADQNPIDPGNSMQAPLLISVIVIGLLGFIVSFLIKR